MIGWSLVLAPLAGLAVDVVVQASLSWAKRTLRASIVAGSACGIGAAIFLSIRALRAAGVGGEDFFALLTLNAITSLMLAFGYFALVNLNATSIRIRILKEIHHCGAMSRDELARHYDESKLIEDRLERLVREKQMVERDGRCRIEGAPFLLVVARTVAVMKRVVMGRATS